ncbi:DUF3617 family protein [Sphingomonas sp. LHG3406-1]|uniref:DUF3617 domain-containing protein n=1 Tax=Sphingomonas sp. LHG3406-1 TaxID=2804617 RepID=UPI00262C97CC|nr:DUF3617 family protein [Sphingomonas sp. LHG3406-1]
MKRYLLVLAAGTAIAACSQEAEAPKQAAIPASLPAGEYEVTATVTSLASTDKTPLPTFTKEGDRKTTRGCVGADGLPAAELLAAKGDTCQLQNPYARSGRMNVTLDCDRTGQGKVMAVLDGKYTADGFTGTVTSTSAFPGPGDYKLVEEISARKVADQCTAAPTSAAA